MQFILFQTETGSLDARLHLPTELLTWKILIDHNILGVSWEQVPQRVYLGHTQHGMRREQYDARSFRLITDKEFKGTSRFPFPHEAQLKRENICSM